MYFLPQVNLRKEICKGWMCPLITQGSYRLLDSGLFILFSEEIPSYRA